MSLTHLTFRAGPEEQAIIAHLMQQLGVDQSEALRRLVRAAKDIRPARPGRVKVDRQAIAQGKTKSAVTSDQDSHSAFQG